MKRRKSFSAIALSALLLVSASCCAVAASGAGLDDGYVQVEVAVDAYLRPQMAAIEEGNEWVPIGDGGIAERLESSADDESSDEALPPDVSEFYYLELSYRIDEVSYSGQGATVDVSVTYTFVSDQPDSGFLTDPYVIELEKAGGAYEVVSAKIAEVGEFSPEESQNQGGSEAVDDFPDMVSDTVYDLEILDSSDSSPDGSEPLLQGGIQAKIDGSRFASVHFGLKWSNAWGKS